MTGCLRMATTGATRDAHRSESGAIARRGRSSSWGAWSNACAAAALGTLLLVGSPTVAQVSGPTPNAVWGGCVLDSDLVGDLEGKIAAGSNHLDPTVSFIVVYTMKDNDGQEFTTGPNRGGFTGPVICINDDAVEGVGIRGTSQSATIPDTARTGATTVNTLDAEEVFILRYALADGPNEEVVEKVLCHAVNDGMDCFRISPLE